MEDPFDGRQAQRVVAGVSLRNRRSNSLHMRGVRGEGDRGNTARKQRTTSFDAFESVNFPLIARFRGMRSSWRRASTRRMRRIHSGAEAAFLPPRFFDALNDRVCAVKLTPGMSPAFIAALKDDFDAIILEAFGIGGVPEFDEYGEALFDWVDSGRLLVITTQVPEEGLDLGVYEVGRAYAEHPGILKGGDMTPGALLAKTMWVLGRTGRSRAGGGAVLRAGQLRSTVLGNAAARRRDARPSLYGPATADRRLAAVTGLGWALMRSAAIVGVLS